MAKGTRLTRLRGSELTLGYDQKVIVDGLDVETYEFEQYR